MISTRPSPSRGWPGAEVDRRLRACRSSAVPVALPAPRSRPCFFLGAHRSLAGAQVGSLHPPSLGRPHSRSHTPLALRRPHLTWHSHASESCELTITGLPQRVQVSLTEIGFGALRANLTFCLACCSCHVCTFLSYSWSSSARFRVNSFCSASLSHCAACALACAALACTRACSRSLLSKVP